MYTLSGALLKLSLVVYRVSWLRAKARKTRWCEEEDLVSHEMLFVILFHLREAKLWRERALRIGQAEGSKAFAYGRMLVVERRANDAEKGFAGKVLVPNWDMEY